MDKCILQEDDCAPDARVYFDKSMKELTGMTAHEFMRHPNTVHGMEDESHMEWANGDFVLSFDGDDPFYKLKRT